MSEKAIQEATKKIGVFLKKEKPYLFAIDEAVNVSEEGVLNIDLRVYKGFVTDVIIHRAKRIVFKKEGT